MHHIEGRHDQNDPRSRLPEPPDPRSELLIMILVTGASGTIGSEVLRQLMIEDVPVRALTRNPAKIARTNHTEVVQGDFTDPDSLATALAGVTAVFLVTVASPPSADHDVALIAAARRAGVARVVKLSAIGTGETIDGEVVGHWHLQAEQAVHDSGLDWTVLRPSSFASNVLAWLPTIEAGQPIPNPTGTARVGVIDPRDVAAVAVHALTRSGHGGQTYTLTGPELLSVPEQVAQLGEILDRTITTVDQPLAATRRQLTAFGMDNESADAMLRGISWARTGGNAQLTETVAEILGRAPQSFSDWASRTLQPGS